MIRLTFAVLLILAVTTVAFRRTVETPPPFAPRFGLALDGRPLDDVRLASLAAALGRRPGFIVVFEQWPETPPATPETAMPALTGLAESLAAIERTGAVPVVTWEPMYYRQTDGVEVFIPAAAVLNGSYDAYLEAFARLLATRPGPVQVRLMHEPNLSRYHWGVTRESYGPSAADIYRQLWRHIVSRVRSSPEGRTRTRLQLVFCANAESVPGPGNTPGADWNTIEAYYPGNEWVDAVGVDGYNWGDTQIPERHGWRSSWRSFDEILGPAVVALRRLAPDKPLHVYETASASTGGDKAAWLRDAATTVRTWNLAALCWFEADKEIDWRLGTGVPPAAVGAFIETLSPQP
jgi:hypothetical protein